MRSSTLVRLAVSLALSSVLITLGSNATSSQAPAVATHSLSELKWIAGSWKTAEGGRTQIEEHWTGAAGDSMLGMSRTVAGGRTVEFEYLRLEQRADGIFYVAHPKARCPGTDFKLIQLTRTEATFENQQHDFPKRIIYKLTLQGALVASIDGGAGTKAHAVTYLPMKK